MYSIIFLPEIAPEIEHSVKHYRKHQIGLENIFFDEIENALNKIRENPERFPKIEENIRKYIIRRYPFNIIYTIKSDKIIIIAVAHQKRKPYYWKHRI